MLLLLPLGTEAAGPRLPRATASLLALNLLVFLWAGVDHRAAAEEEARLERIADWTLRKAARDRPELQAARREHPTALGLLWREPATVEAVPEGEERDRLAGCLEDYRRIRAGHPFYRFGFLPGDVSAARLLTHQFLHVDALHLFFNMLFLWAVGGFLELTWGSVAFLLLYLASGCAAAFAHALSRPSSLDPAVGASGAVAGIMGTLAVAHGREPMRLALVAMLAVAPRIVFFSLPAAVFLGFWLLEQIFWTMMAAKIDLGVAFWAHLGGFGFGAAVGLVPRLGLLRPRTAE